MPSNTFKRTDIRYFSSALAELSHSGIDTFLLSYEITTTGNKSDRANQTIKYIFQIPDTDKHLIHLLNYLYVENPYSESLLSGNAFKLLKEHVLLPRGLSKGENGFVMPDGRDIDLLQMNPGHSEISFNPNRKPTTLGDVSRQFNNLSIPEANRTEKRKVFVVHGRDQKPVEILEEFLNFLGLQRMKWSEAVSLTGKTQPHTFEIVKAGMAQAAAIIVIFSPDELARLKEEFSSANDSEDQLFGQARPNVILEAGMAYAHAPEKTIFLKSGITREISDIAGFNWVKLDGEWDSRNDLKNRLVSAGASVHTGELNLGDPKAGAFKVITNS